ncbi:DMT family transporter [uncultured Erythrobacter sp.]|uniref:DMT family transporter n=1 Tax=uncultured Erythrobacter sp. TaxID=263913 RepID=UPI00261EC975|nr:DMT family transporter [uncultured Erythrobacter sp.]
MDGSVARPRPFLALGLRLAAAATLATLSMLVKLASERGASLTELVFWRQFITLIAITVLLAAMGKLDDIRTKRLKAHGGRAVAGITGMFFVYGAVVLLPLAEATAINFTAPFFAVILAVLLFKERVGKFRWGAVALGFAGVLVLTQPGFGIGASAGIEPFGATIGLIAAFLVALISFQLQDLNKTESPWSIVFWFTLLSTPALALTLPFVYVPHSGETWAIIGAMGLCGALAQLLLTTSLRFGSAGVILLMDYTALLWATYYGFTIFDRSPSPNLWLGAPLIVGAGLLIAWREHRIALSSQNVESRTA